MVEGQEVLTDEELESALSQAVLAGPEEISEPEEALQEEVAPEVEAEQPEAVATEAPVVEAQETETPEPESAEPTADELQRMELEAQIAEMDARSKHWEQVAGRHGGKLGFLERKLAEVTTQSQVPADESVEDYNTPTPAPQKQPDKVSSWLINKAIQDGVAQFASRHPDHGEYGDDMAKYLAKSGYDASKTMLTDDPGYAQNESYRALEEAYWHVAAEKQSARRQELATKRADQTAKLQQAKQKAAPSATAAAPPPKPKPTTINDMDDGQLEAEMEKAANTAGRWY